MKDYVLKYMFMPIMSKVEPIGLIPIFEDVPEVKRSEDTSQAKLKKAWNYDVTVECPGHVTYMEGSAQILDRI